VLDVWRPDWTSTTALAAASCVAFGTFGPKGASRAMCIAAGAVHSVAFHLPARTFPAICAYAGPQSKSTPESQ
jgi:hypothetical protein